MSGWLDWLNSCDFMKARVTQLIQVQEEGRSQREHLSEVTQSLVSKILYHGGWFSQFSFWNRNPSLSYLRVNKLRVLAEPNSWIRAWGLVHVYDRCVWCVCFRCVRFRTLRVMSETLRSPLKELLEMWVLRFDWLNLFTSFILASFWL